MRRGMKLTGAGALVLVLLLTGCTTAAPTGTTSATPTPRVTIPAIVNNVKYAFNRGDAISNAPVSMAIQHGNAYLDVSADGQQHAVGQCKVTLYAPVLDATTPVTVANQTKLTRQVLDAYFGPAGISPTITTGTLPTNESIDGHRQLLATLTATYNNGATTMTVHARVFTNQRALVYIQQCPKRATLDIATVVRINTA